MHEKVSKINIFVAMVATGIAFFIGGMFRIKFMQTLSQSGLPVNLLIIIIAVWVCFLVEATFGMAVLSFVLRKNYPFRKLWLAGTKAFALGSLLPVVLMSQFFYLLVLMPGLLIGLLFEQFINERDTGRLAFLVILGFLISQILILFSTIDTPWIIWLTNNYGWSITNILFLTADAIIGIFVALGVSMMLRRIHYMNTILSY